MAQVATKIMLGVNLREQGYDQTGLWPESEFSFGESAGLLLCQAAPVDIALGPEMKSTGEVMGKDRDYARAVYKGLLAAGIQLPPLWYGGGNHRGQRERRSPSLDETFL